MEHFYLRVEDVAARLGVSASQVYRLVSKGVLPAPMKIGARSSLWTAADLDAALQRLRAPQAADAAQSAE